MSVSGARAPGGSTTTSVRPSPLPVSVVPGPSARLVLLLGVLVALGPFTIDMYLPALPVIAPDLGSTPAAVHLTLPGTGVLGMAGRLLPETLPAYRRRDAGGGRAVRTYAALLGDRAFAGLALVGGLVMASLFGYVSGSTFVFQDQYGLSQQQFALVFGSGAVALIGATQLTARLLRFWTARQILVAGLVLGTAAGAVLVAVTALSP